MKFATDRRAKGTVFCAISVQHFRFALVPRRSSAIAQFRR
jgi:hypothetical protein